MQRKKRATSSPAAVVARRRETFGTRLRRLRKARGHTLAELGDATGLSASLLWRLEANRVDPLIGRIDTFARLARAFGCTIDELIRHIHPQPEKGRVRGASGAGS